MKPTRRLQCLAKASAYVLILLSAFSFQLSAFASTVRINEVMASNGSTIADEDGDYEDWIELYNYGDALVDLSGWGLSDSYDNPQKWSFPAGTGIGAGDYLLVWASGKDRPGPVFHTNFSISASGEEVVLTRPDGAMADELPPTWIPGNVSIGRVAGNGVKWFYFADPTPGELNYTEFYLGITNPPTFSHYGGFHTKPFDLEIHHSDDEALIYFTLDGSNPNPGNLEGTVYPYKNNYPQFPGDPFGEFMLNSFKTNKYNSTILIEDKSLYADKLTQISSTQDRIPTYFPIEPVRKGTVVRAIAIKPKYLPSPIQTNTYFIGSNPYNIPVISINIQENYFFDYYKGIYVAGVDFDTYRENNPSSPPLRHWGNWWRRGFEWEYPGAVEIYDPGINRAIVNQGVGIRIHGYSSRRNNRAKNLRLYSRSLYDILSEINYAFFNEKVAHAVHSNNQNFKRILLRRRGTNDSGGLPDLIAHKLMKPLYEGVLRGQSAICFINGEFWGLTFFRDRFDRFHLAYHYDLDPDNIAIIDCSYGAQVISEGVPQDLDDLNQAKSFIINNNMADEVNYAIAETMFDMRSYVDHLIPKIYLRDDHYEHGFWRARNIVDNHFGDGRWRTFVKDFDKIRLPPEQQSAFTISNRADAIPVFKSLLDNSKFQNLFINRFADHLNTSFKPERVIGIINEEHDKIIPYVQEDIRRWSSTVSNLTRGRNEFLEYAEKHPAFQRQQIVDYFDLFGEIRIILDSNYRLNAHIRINTILIDKTTLGIDLQNIYPWTGTYFQGVPVELEALPEPGHQFVGWVVTPADGMEPQGGGGPPEYFSTEAVLSLDLSEDTAVEAVFEPIPLAEQPLALHEWDFENAEALLTPVSIMEGGALVIEPGPHPEWEAISNTGGDFPTQHLRVNYPLGTTLTFSLPTTGFEAITLDFLTRRSGQGAEEMFVEYTTDGVTWNSALEEPGFLTIFNAPPQAQGLDFSEVAGVADNADFAVRFTFAQGEGGDEGNNRFDDIVLSGVALPGTNLPPVVETEAVPDLVSLTAGGAAAVIDLQDWFTDPDGDTMTFSVEVSNPAVLAAGLDGGELTLLGTGTGDAVLTVSASDGVNPTVAVGTRVLIYPAPFVLDGGNFLFDQWAAESPAGSFPDHMIFLQSSVSDPDLEADLLHPYSIAGDAHADDDADFPYAAGRRTRINGLGENGISFINTERGRDLGSALVALDTTGVTDIEVSFTAQTLLANPRVYGLRLQYRLGSAGPWTDVEAADSGAVFYSSKGRADGHTQPFGPVRLPEALENQPLVQLQWRYHHIEGDSGQRAMLRLDDIAVTSSGSPVVPETLVIEGLPAHPGEGPLPSLTVRVVDANGILAGSFSGPVTLTADGGALTGTTTVEAVDGVAVFDDLALSGAGSVVLTASADGIPTAGEALTRVLRLVEVLLPQYLQGEQDANNDNFNRIPFAYRVRVEGLQPGATYRYGNRFVLDAQDTEPDDNGAGNFILIPSDGGAYARSTSAPRFRAGDLNSRHAELTADGDGVWEGWLISEPSGNARFTPGNQVRPLLMLNDGAGGEDPAWFLRAASTVEVIPLGEGPGEATAVYGEAAEGAAFVVLHADETTEVRPLAASPVEATGAETDDRYAAFYHEAVAGNPGLWGALIPNLLPGGLRAVVSLAADGSEMARTTYPDGSGGTVNPSGGTTAVWVPETGEFRFLPPGDGRWNEPNHWTRSAYPDGADAAAIIGAPLGGNRNIELPEGTSARVGELVFTNGDWRNRLRGGGSFTFDGGGDPARILVTDAGEGFTELDFDTSATLATDLILETAEVEADPVEPEYGSLRLRGEWTGPGGLVKRGPGMASLTGGGKDFTGPLEIEEGVLRLTEPAAPAAAFYVSVWSGGQLRLVSEGPGRVYELGGWNGGHLQLSGTGRNAEHVPEGEQYGVLGALRFDPPGNDNEAIIPGNVSLTGSSPVSIHVDGTRNLLDLQGSLSGPAGLSKTGGGGLRLSGNGLSGTAITLGNGSLRIDGDYSASPVTLLTDTRLSGTGRVGALAGAGSVSLAAGEVLSATAVAGLSYEFGAGSAGEAGALLRLRGETPFAGPLNPANRIDLFLRDENPEGMVYRVGFFSDVGADAAAFAAGADWGGFVPDPEGAVEWNGESHRLHTGLEPMVGTAPHTLDPDGEPVSGLILTVSFGAPPLESYADWAAENFTGTDLENPAVSGPQAMPLGDGVRNLLKYALGLALEDRISGEELAKGISEDGRLFIRFLQPPGRSDLRYLVEASPDLTDWSEVLFDSDETVGNPSVPTVREVSVDIAEVSRKFLRLRLVLEATADLP